MGYGILLIGLGMGCVKQVPSLPKAMPALENAWSFSLDLHAETDSEGLSAEAAAWLHQHGTLTQSFAGRITEGPFRINRDGTESWRLVFEQVDDENGQALPLKGHAIETRRFAGGPLLALQQTQYASGPGRMGDGLDPLLALLFVVPPGADDGMHTQLAWPFRLDSGRKSHHFSTLTWTLGSEGWIHYEGPLSVRGQDRLWKTQLSGTGKLEGELLLDEGGMILEHRFLVERSLQWKLDDAQIAQRQTLVGSFKAEEGRIVPPWGQEFYLSEAEVLAGIQRQRDAFEACAPTADWTVDLDFRVAPDGSASGLEELGPCEDVLAEGVYPPHHHSDFRVQTKLVLREGKFLPFPSAEIPRPEAAPAHLLLRKEAELSTGWALLHPSLPPL
jgi:hypothetical protein